MFRPLNNNILVKSLETKKETPGGIILPDSAKKESQMGEVIAVGPGKLLENGGRSLMSVTCGSKIVYTKYSQEEVEINEQKYLILSEESVLGIIE